MIDFRGFRPHLGLLGGPYKEIPSPIREITEMAKKGKKDHFYWIYIKTIHFRAFFDSLYVGGS